MRLKLPVFNSSLQDPIDPAEACPGPSGNVTHYQISFQTGAFVKNIPVYECKSGKCNQSFEPPLNPPSSYDRVSVAAENVVGVGAAKVCTAQIISEFVVLLLCLLKSQYFDDKMIS